MRKKIYKRAPTVEVSRLSTRPRSLPKFEGGSQGRTGSALDAMIGYSVCAGEPHFLRAEPGVLPRAERHCGSTDLICSLVLCFKDLTRGCRSHAWPDLRARSPPLRGNKASRRQGLAVEDQSPISSLLPAARLGHTRATEKICRYARLGRATPAFVRQCWWFFDGRREAPEQAPGPDIVGFESEANPAGARVVAVCFVC